MIVPMLAIFSVIAVVFFIAERLDPARPQPIFRRGLFTDGIYCVTSIALRVAISGTLAVGFSRLGERDLPGYAIGVLRGAPLWIQAIAIIVAFDFIFYVLHRLK